MPSISDRLLQIAVGLVIYLVIVTTLNNSGWRPNDVKPVSSADVQRTLASHTILHVGGPHRGGTTLLHRMLADHPQIGDLDVRHRRKGVKVTGRGMEGPMSEGMFQQWVYPRWSIGLHGLPRLWRRLLRFLKGLGWSSPEPGGIGAYAFLPDAHLTEANETGLLTEANKLALFSQWGRFWPLDDASISVLMEKSPVNVMLTRFLSALWRLPPTEGAVVRFAMVCRHPLAVAEAQRRWRDAEHLSRRALVEHWLLQQETLVTDARALGEGAVRTLLLEELAARPEEALAGLFAWLDLPGPEEAARAAAERVPPRAGENGKYLESFCIWLRSGEAARREFDAMLAELEPRVKALHSGYYSLEQWGEECRNKRR